MILRNILFVTCLTLLTSVGFAQVDQAKVDEVLSLSLDSIGKTFTEDRWGIDSMIYVHYTVKNISEDTVMFVSNSCPSLNQYQLQIGDSLYHFNVGVNCSFNARTFDTLYPQAVVKIKDLVYEYSKVEFGELEEIRFAILLVSKDGKEYHVNGFSENKQELVYEGKSILSVQYIGEKKVRRTRRRALKN